MRSIGRTLHQIDELTTGLHFEDIRLLLNVPQEVVDRGNKVLVIRRNPHVRKVADYYCDMGSERGAKWGDSFCWFYRGDESARFQYSRLAQGNVFGKARRAGF